MTEAEELELLELEAEAAAAAAQKKPAGPKTRTISSPKEAVGAIAEGLAQTGPGSALLGMGRTAANLVHGGRQVFNKLTGDEEELTALGDEEAARRERFKKLTQLHPYATAGGELAGAIIPAVAAAPLTGGGSVATAAGSAARTLPALARMGLSTVGKVGGSAAAGAAGGYVAPLTAEEEAMGGREKNAAIGAALGGAVPAATATGRFVKEGIRRTGRQLPEEAVEAMIERLGYRPGAGGAASAELRREVTGRKGALTDEFNQRYTAAEQAPGMPPVSLSGTNTALASLGDLSGEVSKATSPTLHKVISKVRSATDPTQTQIVNAQGQPFSLPKEFTFAEVRQARRELAELARRLERSPNRAADASRVRSAMDEMDVDLSQWEMRSGGAPASNARAVDKAYGEQVAPFKKDQLARYLRSDTATPNLLMNTRETVEDVTRRVPGARAPMRALLGEKGAARPRALASPEAEALMSPEEFEYSKKVVDALRREAPGSLSDSAIRALPGTWAERGLYGVENMGYNPPGSPKYKRNLLYSLGLGNYAAEDE